MKKIDMHTHVTNRKALDVIPQDYSIEGLEKEMENFEVEKAVVLASYFPHKTSGISNFRLLSWLKDNPKFLLFGSLDFEHYFYQGFNELEELAQMQKLKGIKIYTGYQNVDLHSQKMNKIVGLVKNYDISLIFHGGYSYSSKRKYEKDSITPILKASDLEFLCRENPEVNFLISHMAKPFFKDLINAINKVDNLYTDMSGLLDSKYGKKELPKLVKEVRGFVKECGCKKLLFGTDFPVQTYEDSVYIVEQAFKEKECCKKNIYYNNARGFLKE